MRRYAACGVMPPRVLSCGYIGVLIDFVSNKLFDSGKHQVGVQSFFIPGFALGDTKTVLEVVDGLFNGYSDFVGGMPFICATDCTGVGMQVFLRINIEHPTTGRIRARVFTMADMSAFTGFLIIYPFHFGAYKFHGGKSAAQMGYASFPLHRKGKLYISYFPSLS